MEQGAEHLAKFLKSCVEEMKMVAYALGKSDLMQIDRRDLVSLDRELARLLGVDYAGHPREEQHLAWTEEGDPWEFTNISGLPDEKGENAPPPYH